MRRAIERQQRVKLQMMLRQRVGVIDKPVERSLQRSDQPLMAGQIIMRIVQMDLTLFAQSHPVFRIGQVFGDYQHREDAFGQSLRQGIWHKRWRQPV